MMSGSGSFGWSGCPGHTRQQFHISTTGTNPPHSQCWCMMPTVVGVSHTGSKLKSQ
jgi:hypothetical protein